MEAAEDSKSGRSDTDQAFQLGRNFLAVEAAADVGGCCLKHSYRLNCVIDLSRWDILRSMEKLVEKMENSGEARVIQRYPTMLKLKTA